MVTNKALTELRCWAEAAHQGKGEVARQHLETFFHIATGFLISNEFRQRSENMFGYTFSAEDLGRARNLLDAIANIETKQIEKFGPTADNSDLDAVLPKS